MIGYRARRRPDESVRAAGELPRRRGPGSERERNVQVARVGDNLNQLTRWVNMHTSAAEAVSVIASLVAFERSLRAVAGLGGEDRDAHFLQSSPTGCKLQRSETGDAREVLARDATGGAGAVSDTRL